MKKFNCCLDFFNIFITIDSQLRLDIRWNSNQSKLYLLLLLLLLLLLFALDIFNFEKRLV